MFKVAPPPHAVPRTLSARLLRVGVGGWSKFRIPTRQPRELGHEQRRVNVDFLFWMIESLDREASHLGVPRQSLIKVLIARHLEKAS